MPLNSLFPTGSKAEQDIIENLIIESIRMYGQEFFYIPRTLVAKDDILGEDSLSKFKDAFMIEAYFDNIDNFGGQGSFMSKFGMYIEEQATITVARRRWDELVGKFGKTILPDRPCEGDLLYFPKNDGLFEIRFVEHQNPFYQLGKLFVYKLKIELFQYSSERIETDIEEINQIALDMTFDIKGKDVILEDGNAFELEDGNAAFGQEQLTSTPERYHQNIDFEKNAEGLINFDESNPFGE